MELRLEIIINLTVQYSRSRKLLRHLASITHKNRKNYETSCLKVLDVLSTGSGSSINKSGSETLPECNQNY